MSDFSQGPGWWEASDGKWYAPELHPDYRVPAPVLQQPAPQEWSSVGFGVPPRVSDGSSGRSKSRVFVLATGIVVVAVIGVFAVLAVFKNNGLGSLRSGRGTATITWHSAGGGVNPPPQPFSGTAAGLSLSGTATVASPPNAPNTPPSPGAAITLPPRTHVATWTGTLGGTSFNLDETFDLSGSLGQGGSPTEQTTPGIAPRITATFVVTGTFGTKSVNVTAAIDPHNANDIAFSGTVGNLRVTGTINTAVLQKNGKTTTLTASFIVTK